MDNIHDWQRYVSNNHKRICKIEIEWHVEVAEQEHQVDVKVTVAAIQVAATG